ncbi:MAG: envelope stress response membrane protein PspC [Gammaproteobacteria bacterium]|nr:envelope stress response membrane protein PspC [Gammaproteobacteria bacterium]
MKRPTSQFSNPNRLYRDTQNEMIAGVCAGIADYFGVSVNVVRVITVIIGLIYSVPMFIIYLLAAWLIPEKPVDLYKDQDDEDFWRSYRRSPRDTLGDTKRKMRELERKLRRLESYVTSKRFGLDRDFRDIS